MQIGMIGLGRMGGNMVMRLIKAGHECVGHHVIEDFPHHAFGLGGVERAALEHRLESLPEIDHLATPARKLRRRSLPCAVPMDSGWNWTPSTPSR